MEQEHNNSNEERGTKNTAPAGRQEEREKNEENPDTKKKQSWNVEKWLFYAFVFLAPIFFLPTTLSPVVMNKMALAGVLLLGGLIAILVRLLAAGTIALPPKGVLVASAVLFGAVLVSALASIEKSVSFIGTNPDSLFWVSMYILALLIGATALKTKKEVLTAAGLFAASVALLGVFALVQLSGANLLPFDFAQEANFNPVGTVFALSFLVGAVFVGLISYLTATHESTKSNRSKMVQGLLWGTAVLFAAILFQVNLWALWLALAVALAATVGVIGWRVSQRGKLTMRPLIVPLFIIMVAVLALVIQPQVPAFLNVPAELGPTAGSTWDISSQSATGARTVYGTGPGTFRYDYTSHRSAALNQTDFWAVQFDQGYSAALSWFASLGAVGVVAFAGLLGLAAYLLGRGLFKGIKDQTMQGIVLASFSVVAFAIVSFFIYKANVTFYLAIFAIAGIGLAAVKLAGADRRERDLTENPRAMLLASLAAIVLISASLGALYFLGQKYVSRVYAGQAVASFQQEQDLEKALDKLDTALRVNQNDDVVLRITTQALLARMNEVLSSQSQGEDGQQQAAQQFASIYEQAVNVSRQATRVNPSEVQNWIQLAQVYEQVIGVAQNAETLALNAYANARERDPNNPSLPLGEARVHVTFADALQAQLARAAQSGQSDAQTEQQIAQARQASLQAATQKLGEALELKENYVEARLLLASTYRTLGNLEGAIEETQRVMASGGQQNANLWFQLGLFQYEAGNYDNARQALTNAIALADNAFANARYYLGLAYERLGNRQGAIEQFEQLAQDNPDNDLVFQILTNLREGRGALENIPNAPGQVPQPDPSAGPPIPEGAGGAQQPVINP